MTGMAGRSGQLFRPPRPLSPTKLETGPVPPRRQVAKVSQSVVSTDRWISRKGKLRRSRRRKCTRTAGGGSIGS